jgi:hypothetical protein
MYRKSHSIHKDQSETVNGYGSPAICLQKYSMNQNAKEAVAGVLPFGVSNKCPGKRIENPTPSVRGINDHSRVK